MCTACTFPVLFVQLLFLEITFFQIKMWTEDNSTDFSKLGLPSNFGQRNLNTNSSDDVEQRLKQAERPQYKQWKTKQAQKLLSEENSSDDDDEDEFDLDDIPASHELLFSGEHTQTVSSISIDQYGTRMLTSSYDTSLNFWDFNSMDTSNLVPFRTLEPMETIQLHNAQFSPDGNSILVIPRHKQPLLYNRDGEKVAEYPAGDMYLVDMKKTKGHIAEITSAAWEPVEKTPRFATASSDSTVRIWDVTNTRTQKEVIMLRSKGARGEKVKVTTVSWADGIFGFNSSTIIAGSSTGGIAMWDSKGPFTRPSNFIEDAHKIGTDVTAIAFLPSQQQFASRGSDGFIKLWDTRNLKAPMLSRADVKSSTEGGGGLVFDPRDKYLGTHLLAGTDEGKVHVLDTSDLQTLTTIDCYEKNDENSSGISSLCWSKKLNQIVAGTTNGDIKIFFSPEQSNKGVKLIFEKTPKRKHIDDNNSLTVNISAAGLEAGISEEREMQQAQIRKRKLQKQREREGETAVFDNNSGEIQPTKMDALKYKQSAELSQRQAAKKKYVVMNMGDAINEDSREELLKYAKNEGENNSKRLNEDDSSFSNNKRSKIN